MDSMYQSEMLRSDLLTFKIGFLVLFPFYKDHIFGENFFYKGEGGMVCNFSKFRVFVFLSGGRQLCVKSRETANALAQRMF